MCFLKVLAILFVGFVPLSSASSCDSVECSRIHYDCRWSEHNENCIIMNPFGDCCKDEEVCYKETPLASCNFEGKEYTEGEKFFPDNSCHECVCTNDFEDIPVEQNKNCKPIECEIDLHIVKKIISGCAPVYSEDKCCPHYWQCLRDNDDVRNISNKSGETIEFGRLILQDEDQINVDSKKICTCLPPMIQCKHLTD